LTLDEEVKRLVENPLVGEVKVGALKGVRVLKFKTPGEAQSGEREDGHSDELGRHLAPAHSLVDPLQCVGAEIGFPALLTNIGQKILNEENPSLPTVEMLNPSLYNWTSTEIATLHFHGASLRTLQLTHCAGSGRYNVIRIATSAMAQTKWIGRPSLVKPSTRNDEPLRSSG